MSSKPNLKVTEETWRRLNSRKSPGDTFDDVLQELLEDVGRESDE